METKTKTVEIELPQLEKWQLDVYNHIQQNPHSVTVIKAKRQCGKTVLAECLLMEKAINHKKTISCIVQPTLNQARRVFSEIVDMLQDTQCIKSANSTLLHIKFFNDSEILFKSGEQENALRGMTISGILVIDEGAFIEDNIYDILFPTTDAYNAPILVISTPLFKDGRFYELYNSPNTKSFDWSTYDTSKYLSNEKLEQYRNTVTPNRFISEYLGEFITEGGQLFTNISQCIQKDEIQNPITCCGIDWAVGNDGDYTVTCFMDDFDNVIDIKLWKDIPPTQQIKEIAEIINSIPTLEVVQVELNSIGSVYEDMLRKELNHPSIIKGFTTSNDSKRRIIEQLVTAFNTNHISIPNHQELIRQLQHYTVERTKSGKITYNGIGAHDDCVIALALALDCKKNKTGKYIVSMIKKS